MHKVLTNIFLLQKVIDCFEERQGSGILLDKDRFLLLQSSIVDKALMCPNSNFEKLEQSIQNSGKFNYSTTCSFLSENVLHLSRPVYKERDMSDR